jgi:predicted MFS family arabinose efflux permease
MDPETANENGSGMFVATFQGSLALGSLLGAVMVDISGTAPRCTPVRR